MRQRTFSCSQTELTENKGTLGLRAVCLTIKPRTLFSSITLGAHAKERTAMLEPGPTNLAV